MALPMALFIMTHNIVLGFESLDEVMKCDMKTIEKYFPVELLVSHFFEMDVIEERCHLVVIEGIKVKMQLSMSTMWQEA